MPRRVVHPENSPEFDPELEQARQVGSVVDQALVESANRLVSKVTTDLGLYEPEFTNISHTQGESVTLVARLIEWPFVQELKNVRVVDFVIMPIILYLISLTFMLVFYTADGFVIISILKDGILTEESRFFDRVKDLKRRLFKYLLNGLDINFSYTGADKETSTIFFDTLSKWSDHQPARYAKYSFFFGDLFFVGCNGLAKLCFDILNADIFEVFDKQPGLQLALAFSIAALLGFLPIIPRFIHFGVLVNEIKLLGVKWKPEVRTEKGKTFLRIWYKYVYDFLEMDRDYDLRLHKSYRGLDDIRTALLLKTAAKSPVGMDIRVRQLALALMFENVPMRYHHGYGDRSPKALRSAAVFWFHSCYIMDGAFFGNLLPDTLSETDNEVITVSFFKKPELEEESRKLKIQSDSIAPRTFVESIACFLLAKIRLGRELNERRMKSLRLKLKLGISMKSFFGVDYSGAHIPDDAATTKSLRVSIDQIWLGLAARTLTLNADESDGPMYNYLSASFGNSLRLGNRVIDKPEILRNYWSDDYSILRDFIDRAGWNMRERRNSECDSQQSTTDQLDRVIQRPLGSEPSARAPPELYLLYYLVKVNHNPKPGHYGELLPASSWVDDLKGRPEHFARIKDNVKEFLAENYSRQKIPLSWNTFLETRLKRKFELFGGKYCVASILDSVASNLPNAGIVLFWQTKVGRKNSPLKHANPESILLICQLATFYPEKKEKNLVCSEKVTDSADVAAEPSLEVAHQPVLSREGNDERNAYAQHPDAVV